jgi:beta propeller repeat protein
MEMNKKIYSAGLASIAVVLFLILASSIAAASITETRITSKGSASDPAIYGKNIVWQDNRSGNPDIYAYSLSTKKETRITTNSSNHYSPAIYGNKAAWMEWYVKPIGDFADGGFYVKDLSTNKQKLIMTFSDLVDKPAIYGNKVVFEIYNVASPGVYVYDLSTSKLKTINQSASSPAIYGNKIVWQDYQVDGNSDIYMYDLSTSKQKRISTSGVASNPSIYGNRIVWQDERNGNKDIYMYDISARKETRITSNKSDSENPVIYGNNIIWQDNRNGNWDIYAYDLVTRQQISTTDKSDQITPSIYGNKIVWTDYRNGKPDIYTGTISYLPVANFTASPTSGKAPLTVKFTDKSTDGYYWAWKFGDKGTSTLKSPEHKYTKAGKYTVTLKVKNAAGSSTKTMNIKVT